MCRPYCAQREEEGQPDTRLATVKSRIICIGNRLIPGDSDGLAVYDRLLEMNMPPSVELVEGGLAGLNLLPLLEQGGRVVFVDTVSGFGESGTLVVLDYEMIANAHYDDHYTHEAGLPYLLKVLPKATEGTMPEEIVLVGLEGPCNGRLYDKAAALSLSIALHGSRYTS